MNRDGFRGGPRVAEHEAAHAVIAALSGWYVFSVTIAPSQAERRERSLSGSVDVRYPHKDAPCAVPLSPTAEIDVYAAGMAWEWLRDAEAIDVYAAGMARKWLRNVETLVRREAWKNAAYDRKGFAEREFRAAVARVQETLQQPEVVAAVREIAAVLQSRKGGEIFDTTIERIICRHVPAYRAARDAVAAELAEWVAARSAERIAAWNAAQGAKRTPQDSDARKIERLTRITVGGFSVLLNTGGAR